MELREGGGVGMSVTSVGRRDILPGTAGWRGGMVGVGEGRGRGEEREGDRSRGEGSMVAYVPDESLKENLYKH